MSTILLVEDEKIMAKNIAYFLKNEGYEVDIAYDGQTGLEKFRQNSYILALLDWTLPKMDGLQLCKHIRNESNLPIIMITAKEEIIDKVVGLEVGADDYITKPFHQRELLARIHALVRRQNANQQTNYVKLTYNQLTLNKDQMMLQIKDDTISLTVTEMKLLELFLKQPKHVYTRDFLFDHVWGTTVGYNDRTVDVNMSRLRKKIFDLSGEKYIQSIRGLGYKFEVEG